MARRWSAGNFCDQRREKLLLSESGARESRPFRARGPIGAPFDPGIHGNVRVVSVDSLDLDSYRITPSRPAARNVTCKICITAQFGLTDHRALDERIRLTHYYSLGRFRSGFVHDQLTVAHQLRDRIQDDVPTRSKAIGVGNRWHFRSLAFAKIHASARARVGLCAITAGCTAVSNALTSLVDTLTLRPNRNRAKQNNQSQACKLHHAN